MAKSKGEFDGFPRFWGGFFFHIKKPSYDLKRVFFFFFFPQIITDELICIMQAAVSFPSPKADKQYTPRDTNNVKPCMMARALNTTFPGP